MNKQKWQQIDIWSKKIRAINYLGGKCEICGDDNTFHLSFHHNFNKKFEISDFKNIRWSIIKEEIKKCELLCGNCHSEKHYLEGNSDGRRQSKLIYLKYKGEKCETCGYNKCEASLTFHHRDPNNKSFCIGSLSSRLTNISELKDYVINELDKCDVLCRNCHTEIHTDIKLFEKNKKEIYYKVENYKEVQNKISREEVINMYNSEIRQIDIAKHFKASKGTISGIIKNWRAKL